MADLKAFAEQLVNLTVKEVNELATILKEEYGIEPAAAAVAVAAGPAAGAAAVEEKTSFDVVLKSAGAAKLQVVKAVKEACGLGLKEAKDGIPGLKAAYAEESFYVGADQLDALVAIKSKNEVIADIVALLQSPAKNVISALQSGGNTLHGVLKTLGERPE